MNQKYENLNVEETRDILEKLKVYTSPVYNNEGIIIPGYKGIFRKSNNESVRIMGEEYFIKQHIDVFNESIDALEDIGIKYKIKRIQANTGSHKNGIHISIQFPEILFDVDNSNVSATMEIINSNDGYQAKTTMFGAYRELCSNGMVLWEPTFIDRTYHSKNMLTVDNVEKNIGLFQEQFDVFKNLLERSQNVKINKKILASLSTAGFPKIILKDISKTYFYYKNLYNESISDYDSLWAVYQLLTNYITNVVDVGNIYKGVVFQRKLYNILKENT